MDVLELYHYDNTELADVRTNNWLFMSSPIPTVVISFAYLYFEGQITVFMPQVGWYQDYFPYCVNPVYSYDPKPYKLAKIAWYTYFLKLIDYVETVVFVFRKKNRQISFLHVYHHISTALLGWMGTKYFAVGSALTVPVINCAMHVIMYTYYLLALRNRRNANCLTINNLQ